MEVHQFLEKKTLINKLCLSVNSVALHGNWTHWIDQLKQGIIRGQVWNAYCVLQKNSNILATYYICWGLQNLLMVDHVICQLIMEISIRTPVWLTVFYRTKPQILDDCIIVYTKTTNTRQKFLIPVIFQIHLTWLPNNKSIFYF